jgi:hypothetical protein
LDHDASHHVAGLVRELAIHLFNEHEKLDYSQKLINMLQEVFAEVIKVAERTTEDASTLDDLPTQLPVCFPWEINQHRVKRPESSIYP